MSSSDNNAALIKRVEDAGYPSIADDLRDGVPVETVESRICHAVPVDERESLLALFVEPSLLDTWCDWTKAPNARAAAVYVVDDDGGDTVRVEYNRAAGLPTEYHDVPRSELSPRVSVHDARTAEQQREDAERSEIVSNAYDIDADAMRADVSGPGKFQGISAEDRPLALALHVIAGHGMQDHVFEDGACRVGDWIIGEDANGFVWIGQQEHVEGYGKDEEESEGREELTEDEAQSRFDDFLSECYGTVSVCGMEMDAGKVLKECDNIAYREALNNWADSEDIEIV